MTTTITIDQRISLDAVPFPACMEWDGTTATITADVDEATLRAAIDHARNWQPPLDPTGALATLLAVTEVVPVQDAANAVGLTVADLEAEALAWAAAASDIPAQL